MATPTTTGMTTIITEGTTAGDAALYRLLAWTSPAYPVGAYTYSHGLETAVEDGAVTNRAGLIAYVQAALGRGAGAVDGPLLAAAWRAAEADDEAALDEVAELASAWRGTAETALESGAQGAAFATVTAAAWPEPRFAALIARHPKRLVHPVAFGAAAAWNGIPQRAALFSWLGAFAANLVSAGVRLVPLGQTDGQVATAALMSAVQAATEAALAAELDEIGTSAPMLDLFSMRHETQYTRLFRS
ncbi:urease accessory protein UreF [Pararoseomonas indoligenes]|uniref:Urease accessory protein UreF n=1 Tax=Roseomonas indoligenes TaxID=2820811 RepID=A0A940N889_9PROT|nr:urease accessory UreF family protein [Pararoseomonas indoligenes]MBP0495862.1 urease accessory protein UreF [Pararoseomonas indoligenes]